MMRFIDRLGIIGLSLIIFTIFFIASPALAADPPATTNLANAGHYCISCHSANDARLNNALAWNGTSARASLSPCPTIQQLRWELVYTGDAFDAIAKANTDVGSSDPDKQLLAHAESFPRVLETSYRSADAGVNEARTFRYQLNKSYTQAQSERDAQATNVMLIVGILVTLVLLASFAWGLWNTRHLGFRAFRGFRFGLGAIFFMLIIFVIFALPIFNPPVQSDIATAADLERQAALDAANKAATSAENLSAKAWTLSRLASSSPLALTSALSATQEFETNANAYWGKARALEESAIGWDKAPEAALPVVQRLEIASSRAWAYAAMASEISTTDPKRATAWLNVALEYAQKNPDVYFRALDLKVIAVAWSSIDKNKSLAVANQIDDAFIRAWAFREIGQFDSAVASAQKIDDANLRVFAFREIAVASQNPKLLYDALTIAQTLSEPARAYALSDLAIAWSAFDTTQAKQVANSIAPQFADARLIAFNKLGMFAEAWSESAKLNPGFEQGRAQNEIVAAWSRVSPNDALDAVEKIRASFWTAQASRTVVVALARTDAARALNLARAIPLLSARVQALTDIARATRNAATFQEAAALADQLRDPYVLRDLAIAWAAVDPRSALTLVDKFDRESDRAQALLAVAIALAPNDRTQANAVFDRAVRQAQAARLRGDAFYATELLRELGARYASIDTAKANEAFNAALDAAQKVSTAF